MSTPTPTINLAAAQAADVVPAEAVAGLHALMRAVLTAVQPLLDAQDLTAEIALLPNTYRGRVLQQAAAAMALLAHDRERLSVAELRRWTAVSISQAADAAVIAGELLDQLIRRAELAPLEVARPLPSAAAGLVDARGQAVSDRNFTIGHASVSGFVAPGGTLRWVHPAGDWVASARTSYPVPTCTQCGCTADAACFFEAGGLRLSRCWWAQLDTHTNAGVCTACAE